MKRPVSRPWADTMKVGPQHYQTFQITAPVKTHWREVPCDGRPGGCKAAENGWKMQIDLNTELGKNQARYIKYQSGRRFEIVEQNNGMVTLHFPGGQPCFARHRVRTDRPENYLVKGGDFRGNPLGKAPRVHTKPEHWVEEFAENQARIAEVRQKG